MGLLYEEKFGLMSHINGHVDETGIKAVTNVPRALKMVHLYNNKKTMSGVKMWYCNRSYAITLRLLWVSNYVEPDQCKDG